MKRFLLLGAIVMVLGGGVFAYFQYGGSPEVKRERYLQKAREYVKQSKLSEAIVEFKNAVKADPRSANARLELAMVLISRNNFRAAYGELIRAVDLNPQLTKARYQLAILQLLGKETARSREH